MKRLWILGADDSEMRFIEWILIAHRNSDYETVCYARSLDGLSRVSSSDASSGRWVLPQGVCLNDYDEVVLVELSEAPLFFSVHFDKNLVVIDHHSPVNLRVSSLYQVCTYLLGGLEALIVGAIDQNLAEAYRVFGEDVLFVRAKSLGFGNVDIENAKLYVDESEKVGDVLVNASPLPNALVWEVALERGWVAVFKSSDLGKANYVIGGVPDLKQMNRLIDAAKAKGYHIYFHPQKGLGGFYVEDSESFDLVRFVQDALDLSEFERA
ncbi:MAG: hypothetical protein KatS3mg087_1546 [Patescibacteria group bacterium]|nr:MAG: hypothetical protein KatS3mg087_1546 [Patescibacteria group bacterium]